MKPSPIARRSRDGERTAQEMARGGAVLSRVREAGCDGGALARGATQSPLRRLRKTSTQPTMASTAMESAAK
jgi:hypothetical protein